MLFAISVVDCSAFWLPLWRVAKTFHFVPNAKSGPSDTILLLIMLLVPMLRNSLNSVAFKWRVRYAFFNGNQG
jgi:hypothetical protein